MNSTPSPDNSATPEHTPSERTPFDASSPPRDMAPAAQDAQDAERAAQDAEQAAREAKAAEKAALDAKMALLPDFGDEAFPRRASKKRSARASGGSGAGVAAEASDAMAAPGSVVAGGCLSGILGNATLGLALLALQRAGITLYGPGVLAVVVACVALLLLLGTWSRRVWLGAGGFLLGLVLSYGVLFLFVRPALDTGRPDARPGDAPASSDPAIAPPISDETSPS